MSYCHSPFCLVTPHDLVILKPAKTVHYSGANKYMPRSTVSTPFSTLWLVQLASFSRTYTRSIQASASTSRALNKLRTFIFYAFLVPIEYGVLGTDPISGFSYVGGIQCQGMSPTILLNPSHPRTIVGDSCKKNALNIKRKL